MSKKSPLRALRTLSRMMTLAIVGLIVYVLMHFLPGGWGTGRGPGDGNETRSTESSDDESQSPSETLVQTDGTKPDVLTAMHEATSDTRLSPDPSADAENIRSITSAERAALSGGILTILIDEHNYFLAIPDGSDWRYTPLTLTRARELSTRAGGDSNGIRVRILRRSTSRASAEHRLMNELQDAGLEPDAIFMSSQLEPAN